MIFWILFDLTYLCLGVSEAIIVFKHRELSDQCLQIWELNFLSCTLNIMVSVLGLCHSLVFFRYLNNGKIRHPGMTDRFGFLIVPIWSVFTYFKIDSSCHNYWLMQAPELWRFVMIHFGAFWIYMSIIVIALFIYYYVHCESDEKKMQQKRKSCMFDAVSFF